MNLRGNTLEETTTNCNEWKRQRKMCRDYEILIDTALIVFDELKFTSRNACFQIKKEGGDVREYIERGNKADTTVGHLLRLREEHRRKRNGTEVSNWFEQARRNTLGTT